MNEMVRTGLLSPLFMIFLYVMGCDSSQSSSKAVLSSSGPPNILIIFIDDMGYGDLSCYGNSQIQTPNIDKLAAGGLRFTNFYVNSPICSPSRVALNTGCYPMRYSIHSYIAGSEDNKRRAMADFLDPGAITLASILKKNGYATGHFGKWHMGGGRDIGNVPHPSAYGFEKSLVSFEGMGDRVLFPGDGLCEQSSRLGNGEIIWTEKHRSSGIYVDSALSFIRRNTDRPFYVHMFPNDVHDPHLPDSALLEQYHGLTANPWEQSFFAVLEEMDRQIGRFMDELDSLGKLENTVVIFTSDNGPTDWPFYYQREEYPDNYTGAHYPPGSTGGFFGRKWSLYEGGIRVPFIISWGGHIPRGRIDDQTILVAMDLLPSITSMLGIDCPESVDGQDMSNSFYGQPLTRITPVMWEYSSNPGGSIYPGNKDFISPCLAIRQGPWKLLGNTDSTRLELYNLSRDPGENDNLVEDHKELAGSLFHQVLEWRRSMPVSLPDVSQHRY